MSSQSSPSSVPDDRLDSWKEIAAYLRRGVRTVQRWEQTSGLPVKRLEGQGTVFAYKSELDAWWRSQGQVVDPPAAPSGAPVPVEAIPGRPLWMVAALLAVLGLVTAGWVFWPKSRTVYRAVPLTSDRGWETDPSFSPDGKRITYVARSEAEGVAHIYIRRIDSGTAVRLRSGEAGEYAPAWSPDGQEIAFVEPAPGDQPKKIMRQRLEGGPARLIGTVGKPIRMYWSSDGRWLVMMTGLRKGLLALGVDTGQSHELAQANEFGFSGFGVTADQRRLLYSLAGPGAGPVYEQELGPELTPVGSPRAVTRDLWILDMSISPDGRQLLYSDGTWDAGSLRRVWLTPLAEPEEIYADTNRIRKPVISADGHRVVFASAQREPAEIGRLALDDAKARPFAFLTSTHTDVNPKYSPDGTRIAWHSTRTGASDIWIADADGSNPRRLTFTNGRTTATPRWSPDGKWIAYESNYSGQSEVYVIAADGGTPRRLTNHPAVDAIPGWSRDGRFVYFCSYRTGRFEIWRVPASGGDAVQITTRGGFAAVESEDGRYLYYSQTRLNGPICRMQLQGGVPQPSTSEPVIADSWGLFFALTREGIYFESKGAVRFWNARSGAVSTILQLDKLAGVGLDVSPDGKWLLFTQASQPADGADLYLIEDFR